MTEVTVRQLQYFVAVVDTGSVTSAAQRCHISQSAASMALAQLERHLGADLLLRTRSKRVVPTAAGMEFAAHARDILARLSLAQEAVSESLGQMRGALRVGCSQTLSPRLIPPLVEHFNTSYPGVTVSFLEGAPAVMQHEVSQGRLDVALIYARQAEPALHAVPVSSVQLHVMLPAGHHLAQRTGISLHEVAHEDAILLDIPPTIERLTDIFGSLGLAPRTRWASTNADTIQSLVARGLGYTLVNSVPRRHTSVDGLEITYVPVTDAIEANAIHAMLPPGHRAPARVLAAVDYLKTLDDGPLEADPARGE